MSTTAGSRAGIRLTEDDRTRYFEYLADADEHGAVCFALDLLDAGLPIQRLLLDLVAPAQALVGELWASAEWSVAREHAATHISERVVAAVGTRIRSTGERGLCVVACIDGEWHALPARLLSEVLRLAGWQVRFLGASVPAAHLVSYLHQCGPDVVAVSCALPTRLPKAQRIIEACQSAGVPVLAGGRGFGPGARWAPKLGADAWAAGADAAVAALSQWPPAQPPGRAEVPVDDEHGQVARRRRELIELGMTELGRRFPPLADYTSAQYDHTLDDLGHIVDFLAASLFIDEPAVFVDFVTWLAVILGARQVPSSSVDLVLSAYVDALYDFPRARAHLASGRTALAAPGETDDHDARLGAADGQL